MPSSYHLPARIPVGTKYVVESYGPFVRRYVEFPNGRKVQLDTRKAASCICTAPKKISIVPETCADQVDAPAFAGFSPSRCSRCEFFAARRRSADGVEEDDTHSVGMVSPPPILDVRFPSMNWQIRVTRANT
jgi:hypothetical protein